MVQLLLHRIADPILAGAHLGGRASVLFRKGQAVRFQQLGTGFQADFCRCIGWNCRRNGDFPVINLPLQGIATKGGLVPGLGPAQPATGARGQPCGAKTCRARLLANTGALAVQPPRRMRNG